MIGAAERWTALLEKRAEFVASVEEWQRNCAEWTPGLRLGDYDMAADVAPKMLQFALMKLREHDALLEVIDARKGGSGPTGSDLDDHLCTATDWAAVHALLDMKGVVAGAEAPADAVHSAENLLRALHMDIPEDLAGRIATLAKGTGAKTTDAHPRALSVLSEITGRSPRTLQNWTKGYGHRVRSGLKSKARGRK